MAGKDDRHVTTGKDRGSDLDQPADDAPEIDRHSRLGDQVGRRFIEAPCRGDEPVEAIERMFDHTDRALGALVVRGKNTP